MSNFWGDLIRQLREDQKLSQRQLSAMSGVNRRTLRNIEQGLSVGYIDAVERVLDTLGYDLDAIPRENRRERILSRMRAEKDPERRSQLAAQRIMSMGGDFFLTLEPARLT